MLTFGQLNKSMFKIIGVAHRIVAFITVFQN